MTWSVELRDRSGNVVLTAGLVLSPAYYSWHALGGPDTAEISVGGREEALWSVLDWLRYGVVIRNPRGNAVWWGMVVEAAVGMPAATLGRSLVDMVNRVVVDYTVDVGAGGGQTRASTPWAQDNRSVGLYGAKEERLSLADATEAQAIALRDATLAKRSRPLATMALGAGAGARLTCHGLWRALGWQLYANDSGREEHSASSDIEQTLGWGLTSNTLGFNGARIDDPSARLAAVLPDNQIRVSGSVSNDGIYSIAGAGDEKKTAIVYTASTILFEPADDLQDNAYGLGFLSKDAMILISGATNSANNGSFWVTKEDPYRPELTPGQIVTESAGHAITIRQGHALTVSGTFQRERAGAAVTLSTLVSTIAQGFRLASAAGWTAKRVLVRARKVGAPADYLRLSIRASSGGVPGTELASALVAGASLSTSMDWVSFDFGAGVALSAGTNYFLVVERTGTASSSDFYTVGLESAATYARGSLKVWTGGAWVARDTNAHMPFQIQDLVETTTQIAAMVAAGQFVTGVDVGVASGIHTNQWRAGDLSIQDEVETLLASGTASGGALTARVTQAGRVVVEEEPNSDDLLYFLDGDGELMEPLLGKAEEGQLPAGQWVGIAGVPSQLAETATFFVEAAEYDVEGKRLHLTPRTATG